MTPKQITHVLDACWIPAVGERDPRAYSRRCRRIQETKRRRKIAYIQRTIVVVALLALAVVIMACGR